MVRTEVAFGTGDSETGLTLLPEYIEPEFMPELIDIIFSTSFFPEKFQISKKVKKYICNAAIK